MSKLDKSQLPQEVFNLYDRYAHKPARPAGLCQAAIALRGGWDLPFTALLDYLMPEYTSHVQIKADDPRLDSDTIEYTTPESGITIRGQLARPVDKTEKLPGIIVVHENRGLNPYIEDVGRRAAVADFHLPGPRCPHPPGGLPRQ